MMIPINRQSHHYTKFNSTLNKIIDINIIISFAYNVIILTF